MTRAPPRKKLNKTELIAVLALGVKRGTGEYLLDRRECQGMSAKEIVAAFTAKIVLAHGRAHALGGSSHPTNIWATPREEDAKETPRDISNIAKAKRSTSTADHRAAMAAKLIPIDVTGEKADGPARREKPKRAWPKGRKMQSRPFPKRRHPC